ncbi:MAG: hypothetical protein PHC88_14290 [Terrimicrobiaceae bacterium]|nr:hypothetical protein [Terrimicrobiaceae bacterium]
MRMVVRASALVLLIATLGLWAGLGGRLGWTQTSVPEKRTDPVTGIDFVEYHSGFVPGVEFLALGVGGAVVIFAATLFVRITPKK